MTYFVRDDIIEAPEPGVHAFAAGIMDETRVLFQRSLDQPMSAAQRLIELLVLLFERVRFYQSHQSRGVNVQITGGLAALCQVRINGLLDIFDLSFIGLAPQMLAACPQELDRVVLRS